MFEDTIEVIRGRNSKVGQYNEIGQKIQILNTNTQKTRDLTTRTHNKNKNTTYIALDTTNI